MNCLAVLIFVYICSSVVVMFSISLSWKLNVAFSWIEVWSF